MDTISIAPTDRSPLVEFDFSQGRFRLEGESYPENSASFFAPLLAALRAFLESDDTRPVSFDLAMTYFNSSSAKALMNMFQMLEDAGARGREVVVNWHFHPDDDTMEEFGEDFGLDFENAAFRMRPTPKT
ncbi:DUF1987 domain-containing protein [Roseospira visakhapatnamensis]|uniref:SiaC family regulatory phosphoprotein domain-containing protein n=1 Tax=Roseospira visakhapatnamensis TaxID=390880 RepID=A0A7W6W9H5_9PROT|nr:DUF1987 domain-containing protein [Roseospira visakhapatnamensis]MBB4265491.1 hypothetical protein [Roseospira visakhapatnamensis]